MKRIFSVIFAVVGLMFASFAFSQATYTYTGNSFGYNGSCCATHVSGSFSVASALNANASYDLSSDILGGGLIDNFSFTDGGVVTIDSANVLSTSQFYVSTDATGAIVAWDINLLGSTYQNENITTCSLGYSGCSPLLDATNVSFPFYYDAYTYSNNNAYGGNGSEGTWTSTAAPVPEPESYAMLLAGLGLLGLMARRRKMKLAA